MKLTQLVAKPQLIKITIDDEDTVKEFGESIDFWVWDRQPIEKYVRLATLKQEDLGEMIQAVNGMVLDEEGKPILSNDQVLPSTILTKVIGKVIETLGK